MCYLLQLHDEIVHAVFLTKTFQYKQIAHHGPLAIALLQILVLTDSGHLLDIPIQIGSEMRIAWHHQTWWDIVCIDREYSLLHDEVDKWHHITLLYLLEWLDGVHIVRTHICYTLFLKLCRGITNTHCQVVTLTKQHRNRHNCLLVRINNLP